MSNPGPELLRDFTAAFNTRDLDAVMAYFTDDAVFVSPRGPDPWGTKFAGKLRVREGLAARFAGLPDLHYGDDQHFVAGDRGASEWTLTGTTPDGERIEVRGCDLWTFRDGLAARFAGLPELHYGDDDHFVAGNRGASEWTLTGTTTDGDRIEVRGCDLWTFRDGLITRKDSFWKIVVPTPAV